MREFLINIIFLAIGVVVTIYYFSSCSPIKTTEKITHDTVTEVVYFPDVSGEGKSVLKYTYASNSEKRVVKDYLTTENHIVDTNKLISPCDTISGFIATLDTIQNKDTLHLEFTYPSAMFRYQLSRQPIEFKTVNTTTEIVKFEQVNWYEKPLFVSSVTAGVLVGIFGVVR